ncbi:hypothetical protein WICMUC_002975 [Wickerhamomyces mucosus]|uniref:Uncharacterized protein n=1 Tax=Wickerhamomyces mucosus TaxID=1378264 RepID=A0A9P8PN24_9ASCO|nr:hypothetical protein WICMUC_002975 [Wickerhamomyces mucosus]
MDSHGNNPLMDLDLDDILKDSKIKIIQNSQYNLNGIHLNSNNLIHTHDNNNDHNSNNNNDHNNINNQLSTPHTHDHLDLHQQHHMDISTMSEYDKALFAEVDELSSTALQQSNMNIHNNNDNNNNNNNNNNNELERQRPLSPESLLDDLSVTHSPSLLKDNSIDNNLNNNNIETYDLQKEFTKLEEYDSLLKSYNDLRSCYLEKCNELDKVLKFFKEMEIKRIKLENENEILNKSLQSLIFEKPIN